MTNIYKTPEKAITRDRLFEIAVGVLQQHGWKVQRIPRLGKSSVRRISKDGQSKTVSIRTSQDMHIAFPRNGKDNGWITLPDVDIVVAASVDDPHDPKMALVHMLDADDMRERFDRAYAARKKAGYSIPPGRGLWLSLYDKETNDTPYGVGAGAGLVCAPIARVPLGLGKAQVQVTSQTTQNNDQPLTIAEAKRRLAATLGVDPSNIKISVEA